MTKKRVSKKENTTKTKVYIREKSWLAELGSWLIHEPSIALTLGNRIYLNQSSSGAFLATKTWVAHELAHVKQFQKFGILRFMAMYIWESTKVGYYNNKWERAARGQEQDLSILEDFTLVP